MRYTNPSRLLLKRATLALGTLVVSASILGGCAVNPVTGDRNLVAMSEEQELALGAKANSQILQKEKMYDDPALQEYVSRLGEELAEKSHRNNLVYRFKVIDSPTVNAFALPGGYIFITRGIMAYMQNEAQLAGVLGHEIGHVTARHGVRKASQAQLAGAGGAVLAAVTGYKSVGNFTGLFANLVISGYGRSYELEADRLGAEYLARGGFDPDDMLDVVGILKDQEEFSRARALAENREPRAYHGVFASHPENDTRLQEVIGAAKALEGAGGNRGKSNEEFLRRIEGMAFGTSTEQGVLRGNSFYHRDLDLHMQFPQGWRIQNKPDSLEAISADNNDVIIISVQDQNRRERPRDFLERNVGRLQQGERLNSVNGYAGRANVKTSNGNLPGRIAAVYEGNKIYVLQAISKSGDPQRDALINTANSVRPLRQDEKHLAEARKIRLHRVQPGDTFASLAKKTSLPNYAEEQLRVMNAMFPDGEPEVGSLIKLVE